jgi:hypothetical protein
VDNGDNETLEERRARAAERMGTVPLVAVHDQDDVNHPKHYQASSGLEAIDVIEGFELGFHLGNAVKYILRAGRKGGSAKRLEDLDKARWYIERAMEKGK